MGEALHIAIACLSSGADDAKCEMQTAVTSFGTHGFTTPSSIAPTSTERTSSSALSPGLQLSLAGLFEIPVAVAVAHPTEYDAPLSPSQTRSLHGASLARRREFAAGRACAHRALASLGFRGHELGRSSSGAPLWPAGAVGSISHCNGFCAAIVTTRSWTSSLGFDAEPVVEMESGIANVVARPDELEELGRLRKIIDVPWAMLVFCAKESFYKYYWPLAGEVIDFHDVKVSFELPASCELGTFHINICNSRIKPLPLANTIGRWRITESFIFTAFADSKSGG